MCRVWKFHNHWSSQRNSVEKSRLFLRHKFMEHNSINSWQTVDCVGSQSACACVYVCVNVSGRDTGPKGASPFPPPPPSPSLPQQDCSPATVLPFWICSPCCCSMWLLFCCVHVGLFDNCRFNVYTQTDTRNLKTLNYNLLKFKSSGEPKFNKVNKRELNFKKYFLKIENKLKCTVQPLIEQNMGHMANILLR